MKECAPLPIKHAHSKARIQSSHLQPHTLSAHTTPLFCPGGISFDGNDLVSKSPSEGGYDTESFVLEAQGLGLTTTSAGQIVVGLLVEPSGDILWSDTSSHCIKKYSLESSQASVSFD